MSPAGEPLGLRRDRTQSTRSRTRRAGGAGLSVQVIVTVSLFDVCPLTVTVTVAVPDAIGNDPLLGGRSNVIEPSLQLVIVSFAPSNGAPQLVVPWASVR